MVVTLKRPPMKIMSEGLIQSQVQNLKTKLCLILSLKIKINLFTDLKIDPTFLIDDPSTWPACPTSFSLVVSSEDSTKRPKHRSRQRSLYGASELAGAVNTVSAKFKV